MKTYFIFACLVAISIQALEKKPASSPQKIPYTLEARFSYQWFESSQMRQIYGSNADYQLTGTVPVYQGSNFGWRGLNFWWAADYFQSNGRSIGMGDKTKIQIEPLTAGLKWIYPQSNIRPYAGVAFKYYFTQVHCDSSHVQKYIARNGPGFVLETGLQLFLAKYLFMDIFAAYSWKQYSASSSKLSNVTPTGVNISSINAGGGMGAKF